MKDRKRWLGNRVLPLFVRRGLMSEPYYGISTNQLRIFVKKGDIPTPEVNQNLSVDGSFHRVAAISDEVGMLVITCEENNE